MSNAEARSGFYDSALSKADVAALAEARDVEGLEEEVALLRLQLRRALKGSDTDAKLLQSGVRLLVQALLAQHRVSPQQAEHLGDALNNVLEQFGEVLGTAGE